MNKKNKYVKTNKQRAKNTFEAMQEPMSEPTDTEMRAGMQRAHNDFLRGCADRLGITPAEVEAHLETHLDLTELVRLAEGVN